MIENHAMDRLLKEVLMMELVMHTEKNDMVFYIENNGMLRRVVEIDVGGMTTDVVDKVTCSFDDWQLKQVDLKSVYALYEPHLHDIRVVPNMHEVDQRVMKIASKSHGLILLSCHSILFNCWPEKWTVLNRFKNHSSMLSVQHIQLHSALP
nr:hypothetical protein [Tanacetum cinerariifolium]